MIWIASSRFLKTIANPSRIWIRSSKFLSSNRRRRTTTSMRKSRKCWRIDVRSSRLGTATSARGRQQAGQVDVVIDLQRRVLEQVSERGVGARARPELEHDPDVVGAQVLDVDELRYLPLADQLADPLDEGVLFDSVGNRRDQHRVVAIGMRLVSSPQLDRPLPGCVDLANLFGRIENHSPGGKIGAVNVLQQPIQRQLAIVQEAQPARCRLPSGYGEEYWWPSPPRFPTPR